ncbi:MAG: hypothetical protein KDB53_03495 [Planctomycetes bacterium]|nr:hypothetical protein [Planctomycetota bacterium]
MTLHARLLVFVLGFLLAGTLAAQEAASESQYDIVRLKNGHEFIGRVVKETDTAVTIIFRGGEIELPMRRVKEIVRAERQEVEEQATKELVTLGRYEERKESFYVYYRGKRVGWRQVSLIPQRRDGVAGYLFSSRTVYLKPGGADDIDIRVDEFVTHDLEPKAVDISEISPEHTSLMKGRIDKGHLTLRVVGQGPRHDSEELFSGETEFGLPLVRRLADMTHFPDRGEQVKVYDSLRRRFVRTRATRTLRKELVGGRHQFVTVWRFETGDRSRELWIDGYGGIVREELGGPHMVALRADPELVAAYARGEATDEDQIDLALNYENIPSGFRLARPNLSWSFELPEEEGPLTVTLLNPTLQASVDVVVLDRIGSATEPETVVLDLLDRMRRKAENLEILYQRADTLGGAAGVRFEVKGERKGTEIRTVGCVTVAKERAFAVLCAAPSFRFDDAKAQMERILASFEADGAVLVNRH